MKPLIICIQRHNGQILIDDDALIKAINDAYEQGIIDGQPRRKPQKASKTGVEPIIVNTADPIYNYETHKMRADKITPDGKVALEDWPEGVSYILC